MYVWGRGGGEGQCTEKKRIPNFFLLFLPSTGQFTSLQTLKWNLDWLKRFTVISEKLNINCSNVNFVFETQSCLNRQAYFWFEIGLRMVFPKIGDNSIFAKVNSFVLYPWDIVTRRFFAKTAIGLNLCTPWNGCITFILFTFYQGPPGQSLAEAVGCFYWGLRVSVYSNVHRNVFYILLLRWIAKLNRDV